MSKREKIDVYLTKEYKREIQKRASKVDLSLSDYLKLKALNKLNEEDEEHKK